MAMTFHANGQTIFVTGPTTRLLSGQEALPGGAPASHLEHQERLERARQDVGRRLLASQPSVIVA